MNRHCLHVSENLTVTKEPGKPTLYGTVFECRLKLESEARCKEICEKNQEQSVTNLCLRVGAWSTCPFYAPRAH